MSLSSSYSCHTFLKETQGEKVRACLPIAGQGSRLGSLGATLPKCMLSFGEGTLLEFAVNALKRFGVNEFTFVVGSHKRTLIPHIEDVARSSTYHICEQSEPNGLVDALFSARSFLEGAPFVVLCPDNVFVDYYDIFSTLSSYKSARTTTIAVRSGNCLEPNRARLYGEGHQPGAFPIRAIEEFAQASIPHSWLSTGLSVEAENFFDVAESQKRHGANPLLFQVWQRQLALQNPVMAHQVLGRHFDVTNESDYLAMMLQTHEMEKAKGVAVILRDSKGRYLLVERDNKPSIRYPGYWALVGGGVEENETAVEAAVRELREELGCEVNANSLRPVHQERINLKMETFFLLESAIDIEVLHLTEGRRMSLFSTSEFDSISIRPDDRRALEIGLNGTANALG